jgi:hypothetical protein
VYSLDELNAEMNPGGKVPFFESVAREGKGVFETFRGISHLLMEKVTKDLRRTPSSNPAPRPAAAAAEAAAPREQVRASAPPIAPVQSISHEANTTPAAITAGNDTRIDYGREIELPGSVPALQSPPSIQPQSGVIPTPAPAPVTAAIEAHSQTAVATAPAASPAPAKVQTIEASVQAPAASSNGQPIPLVVPVHLTKGGTYEIVLRITLDARDTND